MCLFGAQEPQKHTKVEKTIRESREIQVEKGPWVWYKVKTHASMLQKKIVPWLIAFSGLSAIKKITLDHAKQMVIAVLDRDHLLSYASAAEAAVDFPVAFADVVRKVKAAAGTTHASFSVSIMRAFAGMHYRSACHFLTALMDCIITTCATPWFPFSRHPSFSRTRRRGLCSPKCSATLVSTSTSPSSTLHQIVSQTWYAILHLGDTGT